MNRIITILVTIFILLLLYIWISHVWGTENPRHPKSVVDATETDMSDGLMADADTSMISNPAHDPMEESPDTDEFDTERTQTNNQNNTPATESKTVEEPKPAESQPDPVTVKKEVKPTVTQPPKSNPVKTNPTTPVIKTETGVTGGQHLVIAGNFSQMGNAKQRVDELKRAGFDEAEIVSFDLSEYHTVCVGRFSDVNEARKLVKKLKDYHKIDAYVRIGS
jgi:cell division protein FtsN